MTLKLGVPSKGRLMDKTFDWFGARGITLRRAGTEREYAGAVEGAEGLDLVLLSAGEIPRELAAGRIHMGVTGSDLVRDKLADWDRQVAELAPLGFGHADLVIAVPACWPDVDTLDDLDAAAAAFRRAHGHRLRIATKYHRLVRDFLTANGVADYHAGGQSGGNRRNGQERDRRGDRRHHLDRRDPARQSPEAAVRRGDPAQPGHALAQPRGGHFRDPARGAGADVRTGAPLRLTADG